MYYLAQIELCMHTCNRRRSMIRGLDAYAVESSKASLSLLVDWSIYFTSILVFCHKTVFWSMYVIAQLKLKVVLHPRRAL